MTMRKILAVLLCVCALLSVVAVVASASNYPPPPVPDTTTPAETTKKPVGDQINDAWQSFMSWFKPLYEGIFPAFARGLAVAFEWLLRLVGIGTWVMPWA